MHAHTHKHNYVQTGYFVTAHHYALVMNTCCGGVAGVSATFACHPFDVLRTRLVGQGEPKVYYSPNKLNDASYNCTGYNYSNFYVCIYLTLSDGIVCQVLCMQTNFLMPTV